MIVCSECQSAQFLQITESAIRYRGGGDVVVERYVCTLCGSTGAYRYERDPDGREDRRTEGEVERTRTKPTNA